ncbi:WD40 repeat domain-containing protein [Streptomyces sp. NPDC005811]|uniref:WD40 repeat domain-containing protein n=1 Tax=Streptomyces sp. NPDC005811 TaxID=3154565 RepID=UPI0033EB7D85
MSEGPTPDVSEADSVVMDVGSADPGFLVHADPARVQALLDGAPGPTGRLTAAVYRESAHLHRDADARVRRDLLALDAARHGAPGLAARIASVPLPGDGGHEWKVAWATGSETSPRLLATLTGHEEGLSAVATATTRDGRAVAVTGGYGESSVRAWDLATGEQIHVWSPLAEDVWVLTTTELDGCPVVVAGTYGNTIQVGDLAGGRPIRRIDTAPCPGILSGLESLPEGMWYPGGIYLNSLACAVLDGRPVVVSTVQTDDSDTDVCQDFPVAAVHDLATGRHVTSIPTGHTGAVHLATTMLEGRPVLVTGSSGDTEARLWDLATGRPAGEPLTGHTEGLTVMATTTLDGRPVAVTGSYDGTVRRWDLGTRKPIGEVLTGRTRHWVADLDVTMLDGRPVVCALLDGGTVCGWDLATGRPVVEPFTARDAGALAATVVEGRPVAVTAMEDGTVRLWDLSPQPPAGTPVGGHFGTIRSTAITKVAGRPVALTGCAHGEMHRWDLTTGQPNGTPLVTDAESEAAVHAVATATVNGHPTAVTVGQRSVPWGAPSGTVRRWDLNTGEPVGAAPVAIPQAHTVATAVLDGRPLAVTGGFDDGYSGELRRWDLATGHQIGDPLAGHDGFVQAVATTMLDGGPVAVSGGQDSTVRIWDVRTGQQIGAPLTGHTGRVEAVAAAVVAGRTVALSGGEDSRVRMWDLADGTELLPALTGHTGTVTVLATGLVDGRPVAVSGGDDRTVRLWDLITREETGVPLTFPETIGALAVAPDGLMVCFGFEAAFLTGPISPLESPLQ